MEEERRVLFVEFMSSWYITYKENDANPTWRVVFVTSEWFRVIWTIALFPVGFAGIEHVAGEISSQFCCQEEKKSRRNGISLSVTLGIIMVCYCEDADVFIFSVFIPRTRRVWEIVTLLLWVILRCGVRSSRWHTRQSNSESISAIRRLAVQTHSLMLSLLKNNSVWISLLSLLKRINPFLLN